MRDFLILTRVQALSLINSLAPRSRSRRTGRGRAMRLGLVAVGAVLLAALVAAYMALLGLGLAMLGLADAIPAFAVTLGSLAGVFFAFAKANGTLFNLRDFDHVMSLPIPRRTVVASRLAALYGAAIVTGALFMVPLYAVYFLAAGASAWSVACAALTVALAPLAPVSASIALAFALTALASRFRHANLAFVIIGLAGFGVLTAGAFALSFVLGGQNDAQAAALASGAAASLRDALQSTYPPASWASQAVCAGSPAGMLAFAALSLAVPAACLEIMQRNYLALNAALAARTGAGALSHAQVSRAARSARSPFAALALKEARTLAGIPAYAFNCVFGYVFTLIAAGGLSVLGLRGLLSSGAIDGVQIDPAVVAALIDRLVLLVPWVFVFCAAMSPSAACSVSIEGRSAWVMATAPVSVRTVLGAKLAANLVPTAGTLLVSAVALAVSGQVDLLGAVEVVVLGLGVFGAVVTAALALDVARPNFSWVTATEVVKRGLPTAAAVIGGMVAAFGGGALCWLVSGAAGVAAGHAFNLACAVVGFAAGALVFARVSRQPLHLS